MGDCFGDFCWFSLHSGIPWQLWQAFPDCLAIWDGPLPIPFHAGQSPGPISTHVPPHPGVGFPKVQDSHPG